MTDHSIRGVAGGPAVFISTIAPGLVAGGSLCALAYLQAVDEVHDGDVTYLGPPFTYPRCAQTLKTDRIQKVEERSVWQKAHGLLTLRSVDRLSPAVDLFLNEVAQGPRPPLVYVNGERCGRFARVARSLGLRCITIFQNFAPEYVRYQPASCSPIRHLFDRVTVRNAVSAFRFADYRLLLTEEDRKGYRDLTGDDEAYQNSRSDMYFADKAMIPAASVKDEKEPYVICINANMSMKMNEAGVLSFLRDIWSPLSGTNEKAELILAGRYPLASIMAEAAHHRNVSIYERPEPEEMEKLFGRTDLCVATSTHGSGIKLRIAESLRRGIPVLSTSYCTRGYERVPPDVLRVYGTPAEGIEAIRLMMKEPRGRMREACLRAHREHLSFEVGVRKLSAVLDLVDVQSGPIDGN